MNGRTSDVLLERRVALGDRDRARLEAEHVGQHERRRRRAGRRRRRGTADEQPVVALHHASCPAAADQRLVDDRRASRATNRSRPNALGAAPDAPPGRTRVASARRMPSAKRLGRLGAPPARRSRRPRPSRARRRAPAPPPAGRRPALRPARSRNPLRPGSSTHAARAVQLADLLVGPHAQELDAVGPARRRSRRSLGPLPDDPQRHAGQPAGVDRRRRAACTAPAPTPPAQIAPAGRPSGRKNAGVDGRIHDARLGDYSIGAIRRATC